MKYTERIIWIQMDTDESFCRKFKIIKEIPGFVAAFYRVKSGESGVQR